jgi:hypothetical protein
MKRLFIYLLKKYSKKESDRIIIYNELWESLTNEYNEQNNYGNIYNMNIEFIMSNHFINKAVISEDDISIKMIKGCLAESFNHSLIYIKNQNK